MSKRPEPHPVDPRRKIRPDRPDEYERGKRDGEADRKGSGNGQR